MSKTKVKKDMFYFFLCNVTERSSSLKDGHIPMEKERPYVQTP